MSADPVTAPGPPPPEVLTERVGFLFAKLHQRWAAESESVLRGAGLGLCGVHFASLSVIAGEGPMSQQMLGEYVKKDRTTIVAVVDDLESEGLVERRRNPEDRRAYALEVTAEGQRWLAQAGPALTGAEERMLSALDPDERAKLLELLRRVLLTAGPPPSGG